MSWIEREKGFSRQLWLWVKGWMTLTPHFTIGTKEDPYLYRWYVLPRNHKLNVYLHRFMRDDDDRALHDHPWWFVSIMLAGRYEEVVAECPPYLRTCIRRYAPSVAFRRATHKHRVVLPRDSKGNPIPAWTLVITGPKHRVWGFHCPKGFVPWFEFVEPTNQGNVGKGCGEME